MPSWLQAVLGAATVLAAYSAIIARWGGRAQRQDTDGRVLERVESAAQRHDVTDATLGGALKSLSDAVGNLDRKLDALATKIGNHEVLAAEARVKADGDRAQIARLETQIADLGARIADVDQRQNDARHAQTNAIAATIAGIARAEVERIMAERRRPTR